jgi:hypothetical protein
MSLIGHRCKHGNMFSRGRRDSEPDGTDTRSGSERKLCIRRGVSRPWERPGEVFGEDRNHVASEEGQRVGQRHGGVEAGGARSGRKARRSTIG